MASKLKKISFYYYLPRPGITQLDEECSVSLGDVDSRLAEIIV